LKKQAVNAFVLLSLTLSLSAIHVYPQGNTVIGRIDIPFDFSVSDKTLPAGTYSITRANQDRNMLLLRSRDGREAVNILTNPVRAKEAPETRKLLFRRYGETYFLYQIWQRDEVQGRQLSKSRTERSIERDLRKRSEQLSIVDIVPTP
jgi:hypothetical protein